MCVSPFTSNAIYVFLVSKQSKHLWIYNTNMSINKFLLCFFSCYFFFFPFFAWIQNTNSYIYVMQRVTLKYHLLHVLNQVSSHVVSRSARLNCDYTVYIHHSTHTCRMPSHLNCDFCHEIGAKLFLSLSNDYFHK